MKVPKIVFTLVLGPLLILNVTTVNATDLVIKGKDAKQQFEDALGWLIETTTSEPSIKRN